jgi:hypothetical protein
VAALDLADQAGGLPLGVQGVRGDHHAGQVQALDARGQLGDLVRLAHVESRQQVDLAAVRADGTADGLAVRGRLLQQACHGGLAGLRCGAALLPLVPGRLRQRIRGGRLHGGEVAVHRVVQGRLADPGEDPAEGALARRAYLPRPRVAPPAEHCQRLLAAACCPVCDGGR